MNTKQSDKKTLLKNLGFALLAYAFSIILGQIITLPFSGYLGNAVGEFIVFIIYFGAAWLAGKKDILKFSGKGFGIGLLISIFLLLRTAMALVAFVYKNGGAPLVTISALEVICLIVFSLLVGLAEETLFRGLVQGSLQDYFGEHKPSEVRKAIILASVLFGAVHLSNLIGGYSSADAVIIQVVSAIGGGLLFGTIYYRTGRNIWVGVVIHAFNDFVSFVASGSLSGGNVSDSINSVASAASATTAGVVQFVITLICLLICLFFTRKKAVEKQLADR